MITFENDARYDITSLAREAEDAARTVREGTGPGSAMRGWRDLPVTYKKSDEYVRIGAIAEEIRAKADAFVVIGIGGSYLGARAAITALTHSYHNERAGADVPAIYFAGKNISATELAELMDVLEGKSVYINVISKSGTTLEPALAFRVLHAWLSKRYSAEEMKERVIATTDARSGALHDYARDKGYRLFVVPDDVGGRYSVLTPVGLLPIAVAGGDIDAMMDGAATQRSMCEGDRFVQNECMQYAAARTLLYRTGIKVDVLATYEPKLAYVAEWWKQLFGESEGKEHKGLLPTSMMFTTDLHSLGQYMQQGARIMCETVLSVAAQDNAVVVPQSDNALDGLDAQYGMAMGAINKIAENATIAAHREGGVPVMRVKMKKIDAYNLGAAFYFFEYACAISGYMLGVNPFDQPGVDVYKKKMYELLAESAA